jgi:signal transduction histidine kinase
MNSWKAELCALIILGAFRGVAIHFGIGILNLESNVSPIYKVFNSAISLPLWFIGIALFVESRRQFQQEFEALFLRSLRQEQTLVSGLDPDLTNVSEGESIKHLQSVTSELAIEIQEVLSLPTQQGGYAKQIDKIKDLINKELRPASAQLWNGSILSAPKLSKLALIRISLLEQRLKVASASFFFSPYIFIGLNGTLGWRLAFIETLLATILNILIYLTCELLFRNGIFNRGKTNIAILGLSYLLPLFTILFILPETLFWTDSAAAIFLYQFFLTACHIFLLLGLNLYKLLGQQRSVVLRSFEEIIQGKELLPISDSDLRTARDIDLARYLHGELQAGLIATSLLLEQATSKGDMELARSALRSAIEILNQDHAQVSQSRISSRHSRLEKLSSGWRGIADVEIELDWIEALEISTLNNLIELIEEGVSNAIRHAKATTISVKGKLVGEFIEVEIASNGTKMTSNVAGLGTKLFTELASSWDYSRKGELNLLNFRIRNNV